MFESSQLTQLEKLVDRMNILCIALDRWVTSELPPHHAISNVANELWRDMHNLKESLTQKDGNQYSKIYQSRIQPLTEQ